MTKECRKCGKSLSLDCFYKRAASADGLTPSCKPCTKAARAKFYRENKEKIAEKNSRHYQANKESRKDRQRAWYKANRDHAINYAKRYREENKEAISAHGKDYRRKNKERIARVNKAWRKENREAINAKANEAVKSRYRSDPAFNLVMRARTQARSAIRGLKVVGFFRHMPYTTDEFVSRLISTLPDGYSESDICDGTKLHIDHIRPVSSFNLTGEVDDEFLACWSLDNLQLLPADENIKKSNRMDWNYGEEETDL